jgi:hypothetical protein
MPPLQQSAIRQTQLQRIEARAMGNGQWAMGGKLTIVIKIAFLFQSKLISLEDREPVFSTLQI